MREYGVKREMSFRTKFVATILILLAYRVLSHIPLPFVNPEYVKALIDGNSTMSFFNSLTGGSFGQMSVMAMGITPYINASIIIQLFSIAFPKLEELQKDGASGAKKMKHITLVLGVILGFVQAGMMLIGFGQDGLLTKYTWYSILIPTIIMTLGVLVLSWAGQLIDDKFFGNGTSLILFIGIVASYFTDAESMVQTLIFGRSIEQAAIACVVAGIIVVGLFLYIYYLNYCEKRIPVTFTRMAGEAESTYIPLKLLTGSVVPIIFASSILVIPVMIDMVTKHDCEWVRFCNATYWFRSDMPIYSIGALVYCAMIFGFSYYYNNMNMNAAEVAENLRKQGGFVFGVRPGKDTEVYLKQQLKYLTFLGAVGLCIAALLPDFFYSVLHMPKVGFFGTSVIIILQVAEETMKAYRAEHLGQIPKGKNSFLGFVTEDSIF